MRVAILAGADFKGAWHVLKTPGDDFTEQKRLFKNIVEADGAATVDGKNVDLQRIVLFNSSGPAKRAKFDSPEQRKARAKELAEIKAKREAAEAAEKKAEHGAGNDKAKPKAGGK